MAPTICFMRETTLERLARRGADRADLAHRALESCVPSFEAAVTWRASSVEPAAGLGDGARTGGLLDGGAAHLLRHLAHHLVRAYHARASARLFRRGREISAERSETSCTARATSRLPRACSPVASAMRVLIVTARSELTMILRSAWSERLTASTPVSTRVTRRA